MKSVLAGVVASVLAPVALAQAPPPAAWAFAVSGDSRDCGDLVMPKIARSIESEVAGPPAEFYWHLGDFRRMYDIDCDILKRRHPSYDCTSMAPLPACRSCSSTPAPSFPASCLRRSISVTSSSSRSGNPRSCRRSPQSERRVELPPFAQALAPQGSNALMGLWRALTGGGSAGVAKRTVLAQLLVTLVPALFIAALLGTTYRVATAPEVEASTAGLIEAGGLVAAPEAESEASNRPHRRAGTGRRAIAGEGIPG